MDNLRTYTKPIIVYLPSATVQGTLVSNHERLSEYLNTRGANDTILLQDVKVGDLRGKIPALSSKNIILYFRQVMFVVDLGLGAIPDKSKDLFDVNGDTHEGLEVVMGIGPHWLSGTVHLLPGGNLRSFAEGASRFIQLTGATLLDGPECEPRTFLINREKVDYLMPS